MDDNQNVDGFDGLPLDLWMTHIQQPHMTSTGPSLPTNVYHQSSDSQTTRDYMSPMTMPASFSSGGTVSHQGQSLLSSLTQSQLPHSLPSRPLHQVSHTPVSERSAWSQLLALDPTAGGDEPYSSIHNVSYHETHLRGSRDQPLMSVKGTDGTQLPVSFDNKTMPRVYLTSASTASFATAINDYSSSHHLSSTDSKTPQHLNELMNLSKKMAQSIRNTESANLSIPRTTASSELAGSYSPVSPPATMSDEPPTTNTGFSSGKMAEILLREPPETTTSMHSLFSEQSDMFNYISHKSDLYPSEPSSVDSAATTKSSQVATSSTLSPFIQSPSNSPLDMTTSIGSKYDRTWQEPTLKVASQTDIELGLTSSPISTVREQVPLLHTLLSKKPVLPMDAANDVGIVPSDGKRQPHPASISFHEKVIKPVKSTPKKSNFYGRDASLFSFSPLGENDSGSCQALSSSETANMVSQSGLNTTSAASVLSTNSTEGEIPFSFTIASSCSTTDPAPTDSASNTTGVYVTSSVPTNTTQGDSAAELKSFTETAVSGTVANIVGTEQDISETHSSEFREDAGVMAVSEEAICHHHDEVQSKMTDNSQSVDDHDGTISYFENNDESNINQAVQNSIKDSFDEETASSDLHISEATVPCMVMKGPNKLKLTKRKKRKATGFQTKSRKKPVQKKKGAQFVQMNTEIVSPEMTIAMQGDGTELVTGEGTDENGTNSVDLSESQASVRKRPGTKLKSANSGAAPRRSSSRKSKDNAMRLIELQADSNYNGIAGSAPEVAVDVNRKPARKRKVQDNSKPFIDEDTDVTEDENDSLEESDEKDGDYVIDEDDAEILDIDKKLEEQIELKRKPKEKRFGGLKISIKLSGDSSAEIVSGISDSPVKKKRKVSKKKLSKKQEKRKPSVEELDSLEEPKQEMSGVDDDNLQSLTDSSVGEKSEHARDRHMSLMEKYFSTANSATAAQQMKKKSATTESGLKRKSKLKSEELKAGKGKIKSSKSSVEGNKKLNQTDSSTQKQKGSVKFNLETDTGEKLLDVKNDSEASVPKFVCGYCPQRYHNKDDLRAHMEDHMVEMEGKINVNESQEVTESKKLSFSSSVNHNSSRDPRSQRSSPGGIGPPSKTGVSDKAKVKSNAEHTKDLADKPVTVVVKQVFNCGECGQVFSSKPNLLDHVRIHTADKPFECDICHKCFTERHLLSLHRKTHGQEKLMRCQMCSKAFVHKADLNFHMQSHPKRSANVLSGKRPVSTKKSSKKINDMKDPDDATAPKKPKSFASALSGDLDLGGKDKDAPAVLVLKRGDLAQPESKNSGGSLGKTNESKLSIKQGTSANSTIKTNDGLKKPVESKTKSENIKEKSQSKVSTEAQNSIEKKQKEPGADSANVCTCKECPECVTRFLQSFE